MTSAEVLFFRTVQSRSGLGYMSLRLGLFLDVFFLPLPFRESSRVFLPQRNEGPRKGRERKRRLGRERERGRGDQRNRRKREKEAIWKREGERKRRSENKVLIGVESFRSPSWRTKSKRPATAECLCRLDYN
ncbi:hypothetical protein ACLB2K_024899 [Fragaria x ananassa]